jgi:hypothetical protein
MLCACILLVLVPRTGIPFPDMVISLKFDPSKVQSAQLNILQSRNGIMSVASNVLLLLFFYLQTKMCNILMLISVTKFTFQTAANVFGKVTYFIHLSSNS